MTYNHTNFAYAVGRIRVLETTLLHQNEVERMLGAKDAQEAYRVLNDLDYANHVGDVDNVENFQEVINAGLREVKSLLEKITPDQRILKILWYRYDFHNIRTLIRAKINPMPEQELEDNYLMNLGAYSPHLLQKFIFEDKYGDKIDRNLRQVIKEAESLYQEKDSSFWLDLFLDKKFFALVSQINKKIGSSFVREFLTLSIDIANLKTFFRMNQLEMIDLISEAIIPGGSVPTELFNHDQEKFLEEISSTKYFKTVKSGMEYYQKTGSFLELEKELDNMIVELMQQGRRVAIGAEPLFAYFWAKKNNAQIIRSIMIGKINHVEDQEIRNQMRKLYS